MNETRTFEHLSRQSLDEHEQIHFFLDQLLRALTEVGRVAPDVEGLRRLAAELEGLAERLREHFEWEENGGLFQAVIEADEGSADAVRRLTDQHARLLEILEMATIHAERGQADDIEPLREDLAGFVEVLRTHERFEESLFRRHRVG